MAAEFVVVVIVVAFPDGEDVGDEDVCCTAVVGAAVGADVV